MIFLASNKIHVPYSIYKQIVWNRIQLVCPSPNSYKIKCLTFHRLKTLLLASTIFIGIVEHLKENSLSFGKQW